MPNINYLKLGLLVICTVLYCIDNSDGAITVHKVELYKSVITSWLGGPSLENIIERWALGRPVER